jgi:hypothetical protein
MIRISMRIARRHRVGLAIIAVGLLPLAALSIWRATLNDVPVHRPISLSVGHVRQPFKVNFTGTYTMRVEVERKLPHRTIQCLMGIRDYVPKGECRNIAPVLNFNWTLTQDGRTLESGSSTSATSGAYTNDSVAEQFAWFQGKRGGHYVLDMDILEDGSALSVANPNLRIGVDESYYEDFIFLELATVAWAVLGCVSGIVTLAVSFLLARKRGKIANGDTRTSASLSGC